jgi:hypothetical protein
VWRRHRDARLVLGIGAAVVCIAVTVLLTVDLHDSGRPPVAKPAPAVTTPPPALASASFNGWPDASNTGVPPGPGELRRVGRLIVTKDGAAFTRLDISDCVDIQANDVVITESIIHCGRSAAAVRILGAATNAVLDQVEIDGGGAASACIAPQNFTIENSNLHDCVDGIDFNSNVTVLSCFIHDLARTSDSHNDTLQTLGGTDDLIKDNTLDAYRADTNDLMNSAIQTGHLNMPLTNVLIDHNFMDGGNYTVNAGSTSRDGHPITGYVFKDNVFGRHYRYGPVQAVGAGTSFDDSNVWSDDGQPVRKKS